jgi:hypothetical protein
MARSITLTLGAGLGADLGPNFDLTADVGVVTPSTATKTELTAGKSVSVDDLATQVTVTSTGTCTNAITQTIPCAGGTTTTTSTTTSTSTSTTTIAPTSSEVFISVQLSLDVEITGVKVDNVFVTANSPFSFPVNNGTNDTINATSNKVGTYDVIVFYNSSIPGQNISVTDSNNVSSCQNTSTGNQSLTFTNQYLDGVTSPALSISATDGTCI